MDHYKGPTQKVDPAKVERLKTFMKNLDKGQTIYLRRSKIVTFPSGNRLSDGDMATYEGKGTVTVLTGRFKGATNVDFMEFAGNASPVLERRTP